MRIAEKAADPQMARDTLVIAASRRSRELIIQVKDTLKYTNDYFLVGQFSKN